MKKIQANEIINLIENHISYAKKLDIIRRASNRELTKALRLTSNSLTRQILCDILGEKHAQVALLPLVRCLDDASSGVRSSAADALGKLKNYKAGRPLIEHFKIESDPGTQRMIAAVLSAVHYKPAIPLLMHLLKSQDISMRGTAALALGELKAFKALDLLENLLIRETDSYPRQGMEFAIWRIKTH